MLLANIIYTIALAGTAYAGCYTGGEPWGDVQGALAEVDKICPQFTGIYGPSGTVSGYRGKCVNWNNKQIQFQIWHSQDGSRILSLDDCKTHLKHEISGCEFGGESGFKDWKFKSDPNQGPCI
ncbi:hypothetical protein F4779DRAFT_572654 [Xylariaceae sp. FL0662B]|nr:hypothetical protein F4779DRAFT_572654 [Xylariaceae sp. FL0662B]